MMKTALGKPMFKIQIIPRALQNMRDDIVSYQVMSRICGMKVMTHFSRRPISKPRMKELYERGLGKFYS